jgi:uncharacterized radical SAM superfamily Fe-S cluster-containing enzyme
VGRIELQVMASNDHTSNHAIHFACPNFDICRRVYFCEVEIFGERMRAKAETKERGDLDRSEAQKRLVQ